MRKTIKDIVKSFCDTYVPAGADGQIGRVAQRFGLIAAGGEIATLYEIVPWSRGDAVKAAAICFEQWLAARGGHEAAETAAGIEQVRSFLLANGMSRFIPAWDDNPPKGMNARDVAGFREQRGDGWDYYVTTTAWKEICAGLDPRRVAVSSVGPLVRICFIRCRHHYLEARRREGGRRRSYYAGHQS
jgi:uncharacterized protein (DUF927 family)